MAQDPDLQGEYPGEGAAPSEVWRSSDEPGEVPVNGFRRADGSPRRKAIRVSVPPGSFRVGCICMDDSRSATRSTGACSGHGGVRYWLYRTAEGDTFKLMTGRHERHPRPLDASELSSLAQVKAKRVKNLQPAAGDAAVAPAPVPYHYPPGGGVYYPSAGLGVLPEWVWPLALVIAAVLIYLTVRLILSFLEKNQNVVRDALSDILRHRRRPTSDSGRQKALPTRLP